MKTRITYLSLQKTVEPVVALCCPVPCWSPPIYLNAIFQDGLLDLPVNQNACSLKMSSLFLSHVFFIVFHFGCNTSKCVLHDLSCMIELKLPASLGPAS